MAAPRPVAITVRRQETECLHHQGSQSAHLSQKRGEVLLYTVPFLSLHALAAPRGDLLHPELLALFEHLAAASDAGPTIVELSPYQANAMLQAGPNSVLPEDAALPEGVSRFPDRV